MPGAKELSPQPGILPELKLGISELKQQAIIGISRNDSVKTAQRAQGALDFLAQKGWIANDYPEIKYYNDLERVIDLELLFQNLNRSFQETLADTSINRALSISPTSRCETNCVHCRTNSGPRGNDLKFEILERTDPNFFKIFTRAHFGVEGNPLLASGKNSSGKTADISDYIILLYKFGIKNFVLDAKTIDDKTLEASRRVKQFFRSTPDSSLTQRISFNLYSPHIYAKDDPLDNLKAEFLPLLHEALDFAQDVVIMSAGSFKYTKTHIFKTTKYLCKIMEDEGFYTVRQHSRKVFYADSPDKDDYLIGIKHLESPIQFDDSRADVEKDLRPQFELLSKIMEFRTGIPERKDVIPTYFVHRKTGKTVKFEYGNTLNQGRWKELEDKGDTDRVDPESPMIPRSICPAFLTKQIFLDSSGRIYRCPDSYHQLVPIGNISQSWQEILANMQSAHERTSKLYKQNIPGLVNGSFNNWECGMER